MSERFPNSKTALKYRSVTNNTLAELVQQRWEQLPAFCPVMTLPYSGALPSWQPVHNQISKHFHKYYTAWRSADCHNNASYLKGTACCHIVSTRQQTDLILMVRVKNEGVGWRSKGNRLQRGSPCNDVMGYIALSALCQTSISNPPIECYLTCP